MVIFFNRLIPFGIGGKSIVLKTAEITIPIKETVITLLVKIGKLKDKTVKLNFSPPKKIGSQPRTNSKRDAVAHDQYPSINVYKWEILLRKDIFSLFKKPKIM